MSGHEGGAMMRAIRFHEVGGPEVLTLEELPVPSPGPGELRIRIEAAGVNPVDWKVRSGFAGALVENVLPTIPGTEVAGTVDAVGDSVEGWTIGEAVMTHHGLWGGYAQYVCVPAALVARKPASASFNQAGGASLSLLTAWGAVHDAAQVQPGQRVLIVGAAGGVGAGAVQFAKLAGAEVVATTSRAKQERVRKLGADRAFAYDAPGEEELPEVDAIIDCFGVTAGSKLLPALKPGAPYIVLSHPGEAEEVSAAGGRGVFYGVRPDGERLARIAGLIASGDVKLLEPVVFPLAEAADAHRLSETGHAPSRIVLTMPDNG